MPERNEEREGSRGGKEGGGGGAKKRIGEVVGPAREKGKRAKEGSERQQSQDVFKGDWGTKSIKYKNCEVKAECIKIRTINNNDDLQPRGGGREARRRGKGGKGNRNSSKIK